MQQIKLFFESLFLFLLLDFLYIYLLASPWLKKTIPHLLSPSPNWWAAIAFYLIYLTGLLYLILFPALSQKIPSQNLVAHSFVFGFVAYATYNLTNLSIMKNYPPSVAIIDTIWGGLLTMLTSLIIYKLN